jgi:hypothetical protein
MNSLKNLKEKTMFKRVKKLIRIQWIGYLLVGQITALNI